MTDTNDSEIIAIDTERFRKLFDYPDYYASADGSIYSSRFNKITNYNCALRKLKPAIWKGGYLLVRLYVGDKILKRHVHTIIAKEFIPNPDNLASVNHKDGNKTNNCVENLEWMSVSDNVKHSITSLGHTRIGSRNGNALLDEAAIISIRKMYDTGQYTQSELASQFNVSRSAIANITRNVLWTHVK
jgi:hypothetical protein